METGFFPDYLENSLETLLGEFNTVEQNGGLTATGQFHFPCSFSGFAGHFPGQPVLPAIVQMVMVRLLAARALGRSLQPAATGRIKFRGMIQPEETVQVTVGVRPQAGMWKATFTISRRGEDVTTGSIVFYHKGHEEHEG